MSSRRMPRTVTALVGLLALCGAGAGCATRGNVEMLEQALRVQERRIAELESDLDAAHSDLQLAHDEARRLRQQLAARGDPTLHPEQAHLLARVEAIRFNPFLTTCVDHDDVPGCEKISVLLSPEDGDGSLVKLPGDIEVRLVDPTADGDPTIAQWLVPATESRKHWHTGFLSAGYLMQFPLPAGLDGRELTLVGRMRSVDGREFETTQLLKVEPQRKPATAAKSPRETESPARGPAAGAGSRTTAARRPITHVRPPSAAKASGDSTTATARPAVRSGKAKRPMSSSDRERREGFPTDLVPEPLPAEELPEPESSAQTPPAPTPSESEPPAKAAVPETDTSDRWTEPEIPTWR